MPQVHDGYIRMLVFCLSLLVVPPVSFSQTPTGDLSLPTQQAAQDQLRLGIDFYFSDELESAIQTFEETRMLWPGYADAHWNLGVALAKTGDLEGAIAVWHQTERLHPTAIPGKYNLSALVTYNYGISLLQRGDLQRAIAEWEHAIQLQSDFSEALYALGKAYDIKGNTLLAQRYLEEAVFWAPDWPDAVNQLGLAYYHNGEYANAIERFEQVTRFKTPHAQAYSNMGLVHFVQGDLAGAEKAFTTAIRLDPHLPHAHYNLSLVYVTKQDWPGTVKQLLRTIQLKPQFPDSHALLGRAYSAMGDWSRAIYYWHAALSLNPHSSYAHHLYYNLGMAYRMTNSNSKAIKAFQHAIQVQPYWSQAHFQLAIAYEADENWPKASDHYLLAIQNKQDWALPYFKLGLIRYNQGLLDAAIESYRRSIFLQPQFAEAQYQLGVTLRAAGRPQEGLSHISVAAEQGIVDAQAMLGTMYANGSGTERDLIQAMRWWAKAARGSLYEEASEVARGHLSRLRAWAFSHRDNPQYVRQVLDGFEAIQTDLRERFSQDSLPANGSSVGERLAQSGLVNEAIPILLEEAYALNPDAHRTLEYLYGQTGGYAHRSQILDYFMDTSQEGSPQSCQFLKTQNLAVTVGLTPANLGACAR